MRIILLNIILLFSSSLLVAQDNLKEFFKAEIYLSESKLDSAILILKNIEIDQAQILLSDIYLQTENPQSAILVLNNIDKNISVKYYLLAKAYSQVNNENLAVENLAQYFHSNNFKHKSDIISSKEFKNINSTQSWIYFWDTYKFGFVEEQIDLINFHYKSEEYFDALDLCDELIRTKKESKAYYYKALIYSKMGDNKLAFKNIDKSIDLERNIEYFELKAELLNRLEKYKKEAEVLLECISLNPYKLDYYKSVTSAFANSGDYEKAIQNQAIYQELTQKDSDSRFLEAELYFYCDNNSKSVEITNELLVADRSKFKYYNLAADNYFELKDYFSAIYNYTMSLDISPQQKSVWFKLGECYLQLNDIDKSCSYWRKASSMKHPDANKQLLKYCR